MNTKAPYLPQRRRVANHKPAFVPQERDFEILTAVYDNRFLTTSLLAQLFPPNHDDPRAAALRAAGRLTTPAAYPKNLVARLGKLFHHHHLDRLRLGYGGELIYAVGQAGADLLRDRQLRLFSDKIDWDEKNRALSHPNIDHALMVARFRVALTVALRQLPQLALDTFQREGKHLKAEWRAGGRRAYVYPDAFFIVRDHDRPPEKNRVAFFLEADQSTMQHPKMMEKFARYADLAGRPELLIEKFGGPSFRVLTVAKTPERAKNLLATLRNTPGVPGAMQRRFLFTDETEYREHLQNVFAAIWYAGDNPNTPRPFHPLPPLPKQ